MNTVPLNKPKIATGAAEQLKACPKNLHDGVKKGITKTC